MSNDDYGGGPYAARATRLENLPDPQRATLIDVRASTIGTGANTLAGPWAQDVESNDYTVYAVRRWRGKAAGAWRLRDVALVIQAGAGVSLATFDAIEHLPPRGIAYHVQAQTVRATVRAAVTNALVTPEEDSIVLWIARGRPFGNILTRSLDQDEGTVNPVPPFARRAVLFQAEATFPVPVARTLLIEWLNAWGTVTSSQVVLPAAFQNGARLTVPEDATDYRVTVDPGNKLFASIEWECVS